MDLIFETVSSCVSYQKFGEGPHLTEFKQRQSFEKSFSQQDGLG
jgi:hypothetical protein